jgi:hypothetical protein
MAVKKSEYTSGPESIPRRPLLGFRISRGRAPFDLPWQVEVWGKPPQVYAKTESQSLLDAIKMMIIARTHKPKS